MHTRLLIAALLGLTLAGCSGGSGLPSAPVLVPNPAVVPQRVTLAGVTLVLETYLWRDFMPISPPDGQPLAAVFQVRSEDGAPLPPGLAIPSATVYHRGERWTSTPAVIPSADPTRLQVTSGGGPKWGPGVTVDVVVTLAHDGHLSALRAADQLIHRTD